MATALPSSSPGYFAGNRRVVGRIRVGGIALVRRGFRAGLHFVGESVHLVADFEVAFDGFVAQFGERGEAFFRRYF